MCQPVAVADERKDMFVRAYLVELMVHVLAEAEQKGEQSTPQSIAEDMAIMEEGFAREAGGTARNVSFFKEFVLKEYAGFLERME